MSVTHKLFCLWHCLLAIGRTSWASASISIRSTSSSATARHVTQKHSSRRGRLSLARRGFLRHRITSSSTASSSRQMWQMWRCIRLLDFNPYTSQHIVGMCFLCHQSLIQKEKILKMMAIPFHLREAPATHQQHQCHLLHLQWRWTCRCNPSV